MYIIMLGAPGSGKGTIGNEICKKYNLVHLATGDIFRDEMKRQTELGKKAEEYMSQGKLVPDEITIAMVEGKLDEMDNVLLDGFPRTIPQAEALDKYLESKGKKITAVINLDVPDKDIITFMPPKVESICDKCGSPLIKRKDDNPETIKERLDVYHQNTEPLIEYYKNEDLLETIKINIYSETTKEDTTNEAVKRINNRK